jgi:hypothetical protein
MSKEKIGHVIISWANDYVSSEVTMATLQSLSRDLEKLYTKQTGKPIQITTMLRPPTKNK